MVIEWCCSKELHRTFRITDQGVYLSGEDNPKENPKRKQYFAACEEIDTKVSWVTWVWPETGWSIPEQGEVSFKEMEALRGSVRKRSSDLGIGAKYQSKPVIAGSCRNRSESILRGDYLKGKDTDLGFTLGN